MCADGLQHEGVPFASSRRSGASLGSGAPATTRHRFTIQNGHRTTRTRAPPFQNAATPQRNTTFLSKMTTAPHAHTCQASKCSRDHNETPRYDSKWPPRHTHTHARLQNAARATTGHHVTIENGHRATGKPSIITWCSRFKKSIYILFFSASTTLRLSTAPQREPSFVP